MSLENQLLSTLTDLKKALEGGQYNAAPGSLTQGAALQKENLEKFMQDVCLQEKSLKLVKMLDKESTKAMNVQFDRTLSYGILGGSAVKEGQVGPQETPNWVRIYVPMCYYAFWGQLTDQAREVATFDGKKNDVRMAETAAKKLAIDIEYDSFKGWADFSNSGVFDGNPVATPLGQLYNMHGVDLQVRQSDSQINSQDLMMAEFGSSESVVIQCGTTLKQEQVQDASTRSAMNSGEADVLLIDPKTIGAYNKLSYNWQRIVLGGSAQDASGADLRKQFTSQGTVSVEQSRLLAGKTQGNQVRDNAPTAPTLVAAVSSTGAATPTTFVAGDTYIYKASGGNWTGEGVLVAAASASVTATGDIFTVTITHGGSNTASFFYVYRSDANGTTVKYIGRVKTSTAATTAFIDLNNRVPGFVTGYLCQFDTMGLKEMQGFSSEKMAKIQLAETTAFTQWLTLCVYQPRKNVILDSLIG